MNTLANKKDKYNAATTGKTLQDYVGKTLTVKGITQFTKIMKDDKGNEVATLVTALITEEEGAISTISPTVSAAVSQLAEFEFFVDGEEIGTPFQVVVNEGVSNGGRKFLMLEAV